VTAVEIHMAKQTINRDQTRKPAGSEGNRRKSAPIDFGDQDKKPEKTDWDGFFKRSDESDINFLHGTERRKRFNRLVSE